MKKISAYVFLGLLWCNTGVAEEKWLIEPGDEFVSISIAGTIQKGNKLRFFIPWKKCDTVDHTFSFYTLKKNPYIKQTEDQFVRVGSLGENILVHLLYIISAKPTLSGHMAFISAGTYSLDKHVEFLEKHKNYDVKLEFIYSDIENNVGWNASDYFDIFEENWSLYGVAAALKKGKGICTDSKKVTKYH